MSGGIASSNEIDNLEELINLADERLYKAKEGGVIKLFSINRD